MVAPWFFPVAVGIIAYFTFTTLVMGAVLFSIEYIRMSRHHLTYTWADYETAGEWVEALRDMGWTPSGPVNQG